jgi:dynein heavy chain
MTTLFVKITNQMIINCRAYLIRGGSLWEQSLPVVLTKLRNCILLNEQYQSQYQGIKVPHC